jgi:hypothetical protein
MSPSALKAQTALIPFDHLQAEPSGPEKILGSQLPKPRSRNSIGIGKRGIFKELETAEYPWGKERYMIEPWKVYVSWIKFFPLAFPL